MTSTRYACFALLAAVFALAIAGCGGGDSNDSSESKETTSASEAGGAYGGAGEAESTKPTSSGGGAANVSLASVPKLGMILVDSKGMTLYDFHKDKGTKSMCDGACAEAWPPLLTEGAPTVGNGAKESLVGTTTRADGTEQVTYAGHPVYTFVGDKKPGEAAGNDVEAFGAEWYALTADGEEP